MKMIINVIGIILVIVGVAALAYQGISYTQQEKIAQIGNVQVTADTEKTVYLSPVLGGISLVVGAALLLMNRRNGQ